MIPMGEIFRKANLPCVVCKTPSNEGCTCWEDCSCGWSALRGFQCGNPATTKCSTKLKYSRTCTSKEYQKACRTGTIPRIKK